MAMREGHRLAAAVMAANFDGVRMHIWLINGLPALVWAKSVNPVGPIIANILPHPFRCMPVKKDCVAMERKKGG